MNRIDHLDDDDLFHDTRMSFGDHIEELRVHLWRAIIGFLIGLVASLFVGKYVVEFISKPVTEQLQKFYDKRVQKVMDDLQAEEASIVALNQDKEVAVKFPNRQFRESFGLPPPPADAPEWVEVPMQIQPLTWSLAMRKAQEILTKRHALTTLSIQEAFVVYFKVCMVTGLVICSPWVFYQIWAFVAAGLYPHEKRPIHVYLPFSILLFWAGVALCQFVVLPKAIEILLGFNEWLGLEPDLRLNEWLGFAILMPLVFGISFQTPLVMLALYKVGVVEIETLTGKRRYAWFGMAIFCAVATPTPDALTMLFLWIPLIGLYELGIILCRISPRQEIEFDVPDPDEMIEV